MPGSAPELPPLLQEGGPLPGLKKGSNTRKWTVQGNTCADKARDFIGKGHAGREQQGREPRRTALPCGSVSGFMVMGLVSWFSLARVLPGGASTAQSRWMSARRILGSRRTCGVSFWPFLNSSTWWWLISYRFLARTSSIPHHLLHSNQDFLHPDDFLNPHPFLWWSSDTACPQAELVSPSLCTWMPSDQNLCLPSLNLWSPHPTFLVFAPSLTSQILNLPFSLDLLLPLDLFFHLPQPLPVCTPGTWSLSIVALSEHLKGYRDTKIPPPSFLPRATFSNITVQLPPNVVSQFIFLFLILSQINDDLETSSFLMF